MDFDPNVIKTMAAMWLLSAFVHALPPLKEDSPQVYKFFFTFIHGLFANIGMLTKKPLPNDPNRDNQKL
jgi:hypothetical protein